MNVPFWRNVIRVNIVLFNLYLTRQDCYENMFIYNVRLPPPNPNDAEPIVRRPMAFGKKQAAIQGTKEILTSHYIKQLEQPLRFGFLLFRVSAYVVKRKLV